MVQITAEIAISPAPDILDGLDPFMSRYLNDHETRGEVVETLELPHWLRIKPLSSHGLLANHALVDISWVQGAQVALIRLAQEAHRQVTPPDTIVFRFEPGAQGINLGEYSFDEEIGTKLQYRDLTGLVSVLTTQLFFYDTTDRS